MCRRKRLRIRIYTHLVRARASTSLAFLPLLLGAATAASAQVRLAPVAAFSLLQVKDTSLSHGPLRDEVTIGRTWLVGAAADVRFTEYDSLAFEVALGPYHNDVDRGCISRYPEWNCSPSPFTSVSHAVLYGMQYVRAFGRGSWRPFVGGGFGIKQIFKKEDYAPDKTLPVISMGGGVESATRMPVRMELRTLFVRGHPFLDDKNEIELHARVSVLIGGRR